MCRKARNYDTFDRQLFAPINGYSRPKRRLHCLGGIACNNKVRMAQRLGGFYVIAGIVLHGRQPLTANLVSDTQYADNRRGRGALQS